MESVKAARAKFGEDSSIIIKGLGVTNQRETTVVWNRVTGLPLYNAIGMFDKFD